MNTLKRLFFGIVFVSVTALVGFACTETMMTGPEDTATRINFKLTDAPGDYDEVNINVEGLRVHYTPISEDSTAESDSADVDEDNGNWIDLPFDPMTINLLELQNGVDTLLASADLEPGTYNEVRLILGEGNNVVVHSTTHYLKVPSGQQSGYKIKFNATLYEGQEVDVTIDFDAARSVHKAGNSGKYMLKPVLRAFVTNAEQAEPGSITGIVEPREAEPFVFALMEGDTVATAQPDTTGLFLIPGLEAGTYDLHFDPDNEDYQGQILNDVSVISDEETDIGTITLESNQ